VISFTGDQHESNFNLAWQAIPFFNPDKVISSNTILYLEAELIWMEK
jgi:hypothetical protein